MSKKTISRDKDPMGKAIWDYSQGVKGKTLNVLSSMFDRDIMPIDYLFRTFAEMPKNEQMALSLAKGKILDIGAGAGCHAQALRDLKKDVTPLEISPYSYDTLIFRGFENALLNNFYLLDDNVKYDTLLFLMNGIGLVQKTEGFAFFFKKCKKILSPDGVIIFDSSDLIYLYTDENGEASIDLNQPYYGEVDYTLEYDGIKGEPFDWIYVDFDTMLFYAEQNGFACELINKDDHYGYLAKMYVKK